MFGGGSARPQKHLFPEDYEDDGNYDLIFFSDPTWLLAGVL